jgi:hypothetical protein
MFRVHFGTWPQATMIGFSNKSTRADSSIGWSTHVHLHHLLSPLSLGLTSTSTPNLPCSYPSSLHPIIYFFPSHSSANSRSPIHCASGGKPASTLDPATKLACAAILHGFLGSTFFGFEVSSATSAQSNIAINSPCSMRVEIKFCFRRDVEKSVAVASIVVREVVKFI